MTRLHFGIVLLLFLVLQACKAWQSAYEKAVSSHRVPKDTLPEDYDSDDRDYKYNGALGPFYDRQPSAPRHSGRPHDYDDYDDYDDRPREKPKKQKKPKHQKDYDDDDFENDLDDNHVIVAGEKKGGKGIARSLFGGLGKAAAAVVGYTHQGFRGHHAIQEMTAYRMAKEKGFIEHRKVLTSREDADRRKHREKRHIRKDPDRHDDSGYDGYDEHYPDSMHGGHRDRERADEDRDRDGDGDGYRDRYGGDSYIEGGPMAYRPSRRYYDHDQPSRSRGGDQDRGGSRKRRVRDPNSYDNSPERPSLVDPRDSRSPPGPTSGGRISDDANPELALNF